MRDSEMNRLIQKVANAFDAVKPSRFREIKRDYETSLNSGLSEFSVLRAQARHQMKNNPIAISVIDALCGAVVGSVGIQIEATPKNKDRSVNKELAEQIQRHWSEFLKSADIHGHTFSQVQRFICRRWLIDGEVFIQHIDGYRKDKRVPYTLVIINSERVANITEEGRVYAGVIKDDEFITTGYCILKPSLYVNSYDYTEHPSTKITHVAYREDPDQIRGITIFHGVFKDLQDLLDYEEAEKQKAKNQASVVASVYSDAPDIPFDLSDTIEDEEDENDKKKKLKDKTTFEDLEFRVGMVLMKLDAGERLELHESKGPSPYIETFADQILRKIAAGTKTSFSKITRKYGNNYSAQRQELLDSWNNYEMLQNEFACQCIFPIYKRFVKNLIDAGLVVLTGDVDPLNIDNAIYTYPVMPWIDPLKEMSARAKAVEIGTKSVTELIQADGGIPAETFSLRKKELEENPFLNKEIKSEKEEVGILDDEQTQK